MIECKRILAVVDAERDNQPALSRAYELASKTGASVTAIIRPLTVRNTLAEGNASMSFSCDS